MTNSLAETIRIWSNILRNPKTETFTEEGENPSARLSTALKWIVAAGLLSIPILLLRRFLRTAWKTSILDTSPHPEPEILYTISNNVFAFKLYLDFNYYQKIAKLFGHLWIYTGDIAPFILTGANRAIHMGNSIGPEFPYYLIIMRGLYYPLFFLQFAFVYHYVASRFGGTGKFGRYAYLIAAFSAPFVLIKTILYSLPISIASLAAATPDLSPQILYPWHQASATLLGLTGYIFAIFWLILAYHATKSEHKLSTNRTIATMIIATLTFHVIRNIPGLILNGMSHAFMIASQNRN